MDRGRCVGRCRRVCRWETRAKRGVEVDRGCKPDVVGVKVLSRARELGRECKGQRTGGKPHQGEAWNTVDLGMGWGDGKIVGHE